jgi:CRP/FNR family cyclic AMP-dependent transcriptional regulator
LKQAGKTRWGLAGLIFCLAEGGSILHTCTFALRPPAWRKSRFPVEKPGRVDYAGGSRRGHILPESTSVPQDNKSESRGFASSKLSVLRKHPYFADLEAEAFEQLCRYAKHTTLKRGTPIFAKGDPPTSLFAVISGTVKISISSPDGRNAILNLIGPGEIFGEMALLDGQVRSADATANTNCEMFTIDRREFVPFVRSQPTVAMKFIELLCTKLRWTSDQVEQIILQDLPGRLASALLRLSERRKLTEGERTLAITQQEISEMVGMTRESINKQLRVWAARGWVRLEHGAIVVLKAEPLQTLIEAGPDDGN